MWQHCGNLPQRDVVMCLMIKRKEIIMHGIIYLVGLIVVVMFILSLLGLG